MISSCTAWRPIWGFEPDLYILQAAQKRKGIVPKAQNGKGNETPKPYMESDQVVGNRLLFSFLGRARISRAPTPTSLMPSVSLVRRRLVYGCSPTTDNNIRASLKTLKFYLFLASYTAYFFLLTSEIFLALKGSSSVVVKPCQTQKSNTSNVRFL